MQPLDKTLRKQLETTVKEARDIAENAARVSLNQLGVGEAKPYPHLSEDERELRRKLRAHGRQLGDVRSDDAKQEIDWLLEEVAYEHWHRMLFARFLAENDLLMYSDPSHPIPVTLKECEELAAEEGARNGWELASRYATRMLPQIFRPDSPVFTLILPPEHERKLEKLLDDLPQEVFLTSDSIGWVYQFWQSKKKDEVNASEVKIGARELPAVTQLFTEPYMVSFLLDNSLGAWWTSRRLTEEDLKTSISEVELRQKVSLPGVPLDYLRFVKTEDGVWAPAAGTFDSWPEHLSELKTLDPCCGSGHFLVAALLMLVPMRMELEGLSAREAVDAVLKENLHGLEIDKRCVELAAFALALIAWRYPETGGYRILPELNVACSGNSLSVAKDEWKQLGLNKKNLTVALDYMHDAFKHAPVLGSLLNPVKNDSFQLLQWDELSGALEQILKQKQVQEQQEVAVVAQGLAKAATLLAGEYNWVITNVPYLGRGKQTEVLQKFCETYYERAKNDLATVFLERCLEIITIEGTVSIVMPQNWLFLPRYKEYRINLLKRESWNLIGRLGSGAFETISGEVVKAILLIMSHMPKTSEGTFIQNELIRGIDVGELKSTENKSQGLIKEAVREVNQFQQLDNPDSRVVLVELEKKSLLIDRSSSIEGLSTGDGFKFIIKFWEKEKPGATWIYFIQNADRVCHYNGRSDLLRWDNGRLRKFHAAHNFPSEIMNGKPILGQKGIRVTQMSNLHCTLYTGEFFGKSAASVVPYDESDLSAMWCFFSSPGYNNIVRRIDQKVYVSCGTLVKVPFDLDHWTKVAEEEYPHGLPEPYSDDPTQWIFHGHPCGSVIWDEESKWTAVGLLRTDATVLQVAVARLLGYRWPAELDTEMELAEEQREWVNKSQELLSFADEDGIVCIPPVRGEASAADRLLDLLAVAYGDEWSNNTLATLLKNADHEGKTLETWLRDKFFTQHIKLFQHRPFIWHIWDGMRDGFAALVNYHKLDSKRFETLIYTYLGDWISRQKQDIANGMDGAEEKLAAAESLKKKLELILKGEKPYDIYVRWKPIEEQPIGWNPDLNDGVRLNIRPFMSVPDVGKKGAGVLRDKPNINWNKDRGKDVESAPWYHLFQGERINDNRLSLDEKRKARERTI